MKNKALKVLVLLISFALIFVLIMSAEEYKQGDMNGDGTVDTNDSIYLLRHVLLPQNYPLACQHNFINGNCIYCGMTGSSANTLQAIQESTLYVGENLVTNTTAVTLGGGWSGGFATGFTHASGSVDALVFNVDTESGKAYIV